MVHRFDDEVTKNEPAEPLGAGANIVHHFRTYAFAMNRVKRHALIEPLKHTRKKEALESVGFVIQSELHSAELLPQSSRNHACFNLQSGSKMFFDDFSFL